MLLDLIRLNAREAAEAGDWEMVASVLNSLTVDMVDAQPWNYGKIGERLGVEAQYAAAEFLRPLAAGNGRLQDAHQLLLLGDGIRTGLRLDLEDRQQELAALQAAFPNAAQLLNDIAMLGRSVQPVLSQPTTANACKSAWDVAVLEARITNAVALARERITEVDAPEVQTAKWNQAWIDAGV